MLRRYLLSCFLVLASAVSALAAYPYDSICEVMVPADGGYYNGGSATLIAVSEDQALLLTCQHVVEAKGNTVYINWVATGESMQGTVLSIGTDGLDVALVICPRPHDLRPVPVAPVDLCVTEEIINVGFPGVRESLEWQLGLTTRLTETDLQYTCRPIPGMSGGATLDQWGNLVGVIQYYTEVGGGSTSGADFIRFLHQFMNSQSTVWRGPKVSVTPLEPAAPEAEIQAPDEFTDFVIFLWTEYKSGPLAEIWALPPTSPEPTPAPSLDESSRSVPRNGYQRHLRFAHRLRGPRRLFHWRR